MGADVVFVQCDGGRPGHEAVFVGLEGGKLFKVFVDNPFPIEVLETGSGKNVTGLSTSSTRSKLAVVDEDQRLVVYEIRARPPRRRQHRRLASALFAGGRLDEAMALLDGGRAGDFAELGLGETMHLSP